MQPQPSKTNWFKYAACRECYFVTNTQIKFKTCTARTNFNEGRCCSNCLNNFYSSDKAMLCHPNELTSTRRWWCILCCQNWSRWSVCTLHSVLQLFKENYTHLFDCNFCAICSKYVSPGCDCEVTTHHPRKLAKKVKGSHCPLSQLLSRCKALCNGSCDRTDGNYGLNKPGEHRAEAMAWVDARPSQYNKGWIAWFRRNCTMFWCCHRSPFGTSHHAL